MKLVLGRIASAIVTAAGWMLFGIRLILDLIGFSTVPEDIEIARTLLEKFLGWVLTVPWWATLGFALAATMWLIWVSWPRSGDIASTTASTRNDPPAATISAITELIKQMRLQEKERRTRNDTEQELHISKYDAHGLGYLILLQQVGTRILHQIDFKNDVEYGVWDHEQEQWIKNAEYVLTKYFKDEDYNWFSTLGVFQAPGCPQPYNSDHNQKYRMHWERLRRIGRLIDKYQIS